MFLRLDPDSSAVIHTVGRSGREYPVTGRTGEDGGEWTNYAVDITDEPEVGFTVMPNSMCHWTTNANVRIDRIWAE